MSFQQLKHVKVKISLNPKPHPNPQTQISTQSIFAPKLNAEQWRLF